MFKATFHQAVLHSAVSHTYRITDKNHTIKAFGMLLMRVKPTAAVLVGANAMSQLVEGFACEANDSFEVLLPAEKVNQIVSSFGPNDKITLEYDGNDTALLKVGRSRYKLQTMPTSDFPEFASLEFTTAVTVHRDSFVAALESVVPAQAGPSDTRTYLASTNCQWNPAGYLRMTATDGHRVNRTQIEASAIEGAGDECSWLIPARQTRLLIGHLRQSKDEYLTFRGTSNGIKVSGSQFALFSLLLEGSYPNIERVIPERNTVEFVTFDKQSLAGAIQRASLLTNEKMRGLRFSFSEGEVRVLTPDGTSEEAEEVIMLNHNLPDKYQVGFNADYLMSAINCCAEQEMVIGMPVNAAAMLMFGACNGQQVGAWSSVVMPMRLG